LDDNSPVIADGTQALYVSFVMFPSLIPFTIVNVHTLDDRVFEDIFFKELPSFLEHCKAKGGLLCTCLTPKSIIFRTFEKTNRLLSGTKRSSRARTHRTCGRCGHRLGHRCFGLGHSFSRRSSRVHRSFGFGT